MTTATKTAPATTTPVAHPVKAAKYSEQATIALTAKGKTNPKRAASAKRYDVYIAAAAAGKPLTVGAYLDACLALHADEPRYRWRADLTWDLKREFITVEEPKATSAK